jgi:putative endonuclease
MNKFFVYILRSTGHDKHYIGQTQNLDIRFKFHNSSQARWTKRFQPWDLVHTEEFNTRSEAMKREKELKKHKSIKQFLNINSIKT